MAVLVETALAEQLPVLMVVVPARHQTRLETAARQTLVAAVHHRVQHLDIMLAVLAEAELLRFVSHHR